MLVDNPVRGTIVPDKGAAFREMGPRTSGSYRRSRRPL
jgi:hypothetical protein